MALTLLGFPSMMYTRKHNSKGMTRKNTWVDYGNLAANLVQAAQLTGVRCALEDQRELALHERKEQELQHQLRNSIFEMDTMLRGLSAARNQNLVGTLALARENLSTMTKHSICGHLRDYADKDRYSMIMRGFESLA